MAASQRGATKLLKIKSPEVAVTTDGASLHTTTSCESTQTLQYLAPGTTVWVIHKLRSLKTAVHSVEFKSSERGEQLIYWVNIGEIETEKYKDDDVFTTPRALVESILGDISITTLLEEHDGE
ncbi:MAG: hypothetical protein JNL32_03660 [Candidatus Kapabacteria bacterium]|nr:hypothetical protein [Candidatus Kapabacteria bacterium]